MFRVGVQSPQVMLWQARLSRIPRWGWALIGIAVVVPIVVLLLTMAVVAVTVGIVVLAVVAGIVAVRNMLHRIAGGRRQTGLVPQDPFTARDVIVVERIDRPAGT
jgi:hypothetical protein